MLEVLALPERPRSPPRSFSPGPHLSRVIGHKLQSTGPADRAALQLLLTHQESVVITLQTLAITDMLCKYSGNFLFLRVQWRN